MQTGILTTEQSNAVQDALAKKFSVSRDSVDTQLVGPSWGAEITRKALYGLIGFLIVVVLYLAMAFEPKMAISAIIAVVHDVFITVGIYSLVGFEVTPATVIGFLTILGYSLYDTVVVFDKVRENTRSIAGGSKTTYSGAANLAVNQTLVRSINTSLIALLPVGSILFVGAGLLGAGTLKDLSLALFIGLATGTYSSIFIATPIPRQLPAARIGRQRTPRPQLPVRDERSAFAFGAKPVILERHRLRIEGVRLDQLGAGVDEADVQGDDRLGRAQVRLLGRAQTGDGGRQQGAHPAVGDDRRPLAQARLEAASHGPRLEKERLARSS